MTDNKFLIQNNLLNIELEHNYNNVEHYDILNNKNNIMNNITEVPIDNTTNNVIVKKSTYTPAHFRAQTRYREKYPEKYKELQKKYYETYKLNDEWRNNFNAKARENNKKCRERKKQELINQGKVIRSRGRPRKVDIQ